MMKVKGQRKILHANGNKHNEQRQTKIGGHTYKTDFKDWDRQRRALYNDKEVDPTRRCNVCKYLHSPQRSI